MNSLSKFCSKAIRYMQKVVDFNYWNKLFLVFGVLHLVLIILISKIPKVIDHADQVQQVDFNWVQIIAVYIFGFVFQLIFVVVTFFALLLMIANATHYPKRNQLYYLKLFLNFPVIFLWALLFINDFGGLVRIFVDIPADIFTGVYDYLFAIGNGFIVGGSLVLASLYNLFYLQGYGYKFIPPRKLI